MENNSLDPRINRSNINEVDENTRVAESSMFQTYEVFAQMKHGQQHQHVGSVHASSIDLALLFAKEQYARRGECVNLWIAKTSDILTTSYSDTDIFETTDTKVYRNPESYKVADRIKAFKERQGA